MYVGKMTREVMWQRGWGVSTYRITRRMCGRSKIRSGGYAMQSERLGEGVESTEKAGKEAGRQAEEWSGHRRENTVGSAEVVCASRCCVCVCVLVDACLNSNESVRRPVFPT